MDQYNQTPPSDEQRAAYEYFQQQQQQQQQQQMWEQQQRQSWVAQGIAYAPNSDEKMWAMFAHVGQLVLGFIAPLVIMLVKGEESPYVKAQAKEGLNFVINMYLYLIVSYVGFFVGSLLVFPLFLFGPMLAIVLVLIYVMPILATLAVNKGQWYRYPAIVRIIN